MQKAVSNEFATASCEREMSARGKALEEEGKNETKREREKRRRGEEEERSKTKEQHPKTFINFRHHFPL